MIKLIVGQMNNNRLSTAGLEPIYRTWLASEVDKLLKRETPVCNPSEVESGAENSLETEVTTEKSLSKRL